MSDTIATRPENRRTIVSWSLYDFANSAFPTLVVTFVFSTYYTQAFAPNEDIGTAWWSRAIVVSALLIALLSPILGALADRGGTRRRDLLIATLTCVSATVALTFISPDSDNAAFTALAVFVVANVAFEVAMVYYNSFLPAIAPPEHIGRISGYGWSLGYLGGLCCLFVALFAFVGLDGEPLLSLSQEAGFHIRATNLLVAGWFLVFSIPMFVWVRDPLTGPGGADVRGALKDLVGTFHKIRSYREVVKFLIARLVFNDGLVTVFAFGAIYAAGTFGLTTGEVIVFGIVLNVSAGIGAFGFGFFDDRLGGKVTILVSLVALSIATTIAVFAGLLASQQPEVLEGGRAVGAPYIGLWVAGILIGIFTGPNQSASRSLMGRFVPLQHQAEFFGFFAFSGKATAFLGPLLLGIFTAQFGQPIGVSVVLLFFIVGGALLWSVDEAAGIEAARA